MRGHKNRQYAIPIELEYRASTFNDDNYCHSRIM